MFLVKPIPPLAPSPHFQAYSSGSLEKSSEFLSNLDVSLQHYRSPHLPKATHAVGLPPPREGRLALGERAWAREESPESAKTQILLNLAARKQVRKGTKASASCATQQEEAVVPSGQKATIATAHLSLQLGCQRIFLKYLGLSPTGSNYHSPVCEMLQVCPVKAHYLKIQVSNNFPLKLVSFLGQTQQVILQNLRTALAH